METLFKSDGWQTVKRIGTFIEMYTIFIENYQELMKVILRIQNPQEPLVERRQDLIYNLHRYIFNFLASTKALTDHCRKMMSFYKNTDIHEKYQSKINELFLNNPMTAFIQNFRDYQTHFKLEFSELSDSDEIVFLTQGLLQNSEQWNKLSKEYMKQCGENIILKALCEDYFKLLELFYMWLVGELNEFHKQDLIERKELAEKHGICIIDI